MTSIVSDHSEWLEADGLGGFASGTATGVRTRRYHALLLAATTPPTGRIVLVNGFDAWLTDVGATYPLSSQVYGGDVRHPDGSSRIESFTVDPWPTWVYRLHDDLAVVQEIFVIRGAPLVVVTWRLQQPRQGVTLTMRPFFSGRDYHSLHHENGAFRFDADVAGSRVIWRPYVGVTGVQAVTNGAYRAAPDWYRTFLYTLERHRGLEATEDLATPGTFSWDLSAGEAVWIAMPEGAGPAALPGPEAMQPWIAEIRSRERQRRGAFPTRLHRAADSYLVARGSGLTIAAGYPWFTDWGRDTFIALRGLCLATGRLEEAASILLEWAGTVSEGMLPNRFPDRAEEAPEYNSVDASLWYVIAVDELLRSAAASSAPIAAQPRARLLAAIEAILAGYARGTRHGIRLAPDGLLASGEPGVQLTWMDAKIGDWVVTPRTGKAVEVNALWLNALWIASQHTGRWKAEFDRGLANFNARFWDDAGFLYDVVDPDHHEGLVDRAFRPNQIFAVGGLPLTLVDSARGRMIVDAVERKLLTPIGLRSLAPGEPGYAPRYAGGPRERDAVYHQGTVWPWLMGPFVEAWVRVRGGTAEAKDEARRRFLEPLLRHLDEAGLGHISEIADADPPHVPAGCPFQAWSVGEALRLDTVILNTSRMTAKAVAMATR